MKPKYNHFKPSADGQKAIEEKALQRFADLMISRMEQMRDSKWEQGWLSGAGVGLPQNIKTGVLNGSNRLILSMHTCMNGYKMPLYLTMKQADDLGCQIKAGSKSIPVVYWIPFYTDQDGNRVDSDKVKDMSDDELEAAGIIRRTSPRYYSEFNIDQTNLEELFPEKYAKLLERFHIKGLKGEDGMYVNPAIDRMIEKQEWLCPVIFDKNRSCPAYSPGFDQIYIPFKEQFNIHENPKEIYKDGMEYYSSFIHEAMHSTGHPSRLNREKEGNDSRKDYAWEECIAEFSAATAGQALGFDVRINKNNVAYLNSWISVLKEKPEIIKDMLGDIHKASNMFLESVNKQKIALGEDPIFGRKSIISDEEKGELKHYMTGKRIVNFIVKRCTNEAPDACFERPQRYVIQKYLEAYHGEDAKKAEIVRLWDEAEKHPSVKKTYQEWKDDAKAELIELVNGVERQVSNGLRR